MELKNKILKRCIQQQEETIDNLSKAVKEAQKSANEYGTPRDRYDSYRAQILRKRDMFSKQLVDAKEIIDVLNQIPTKKMDKIDFGSLVETDKNNFFIATGAGEIEIDDKKFFAVSPIVPIVRAMKGMSTGDKFSFNGIEYTILSVS